MQERTGAQLEQIEAFAAVAEHGGFAAAARVLGRDPSVLSRRLDALEARLGVRLLARTTRRITVTEAGTDYLHRVRAILADLAAADAEASDRAATPRGLLRLTLPATFAQRWIAPWLPEFLAAHPALRLELVHTNDVVDLVADGMDAAVRIGELVDSNLVARRLATFDTVLCAAPAHLAAHGVPQRPEDLGRHACLCFPKPRFWPDWRLRRGSERVVQRVSGPIVTDDDEVLLVACRGGAGIMPAPEWLIGRDLAEGRLVRVLPGWRFDGDAAVHVVLPPGRLMPAKTRVFVDRLVQAFVPTAPWHALGATDAAAASRFTARVPADD